MLYLLYGTDVHASRAKLHSLLESLFKKRPDATYFHITDETPYNLEELIHSQGLFEQKYIVVFDMLFNDKDAKDTLVAEMKAYKESEHIFIFLEGKLDKKTLTKFEKYAEKVQLFEGTESKKERFNVFSLTDALGERNRKKLWVLYQEAKSTHVADEEIHGILFWQVKTMLIARASKNVKESGLNPFVFKKSLGFLSNYTQKEVEKLSHALVALSHDARRGVHEFDTALERFILSV